MKELKSNEVIAYAAAFVSFVLPKIQIKEIILFGSGARGEVGKESDIDLFFDVDKDEERIKEIIKEELKKFYKSRVAEVWLLKGVKNPISVHVGKLEEWKLKRSIISNGISLYGKYKEIPKGMKGYVFFQIEPIKDIAKRNKVIRGLFGRKEKNYFANGILKEFSGKKLSSSSFIILKEHAGSMIGFLGKERVRYRFFEFWSDEALEQK